MYVSYIINNTSVGSQKSEQRKTQPLESRHTQLEIACKMANV